MKGMKTMGRYAQLLFIGCLLTNLAHRCCASRVAVLAVDTSRTMRDKLHWQDARSLAERVLTNQLGENDTCFLLTFQDRADEAGTYRLPEQLSALRAALELSVAKQARGRTSESFTGIRDFAVKFLKERGTSSERRLFLITDGAPSLKSRELVFDKVEGQGVVRLYSYRLIGAKPTELPPQPTSLRLAPEGLSMRDARWDFGEAASDEPWRPEFRVSSEPPSALPVTLTAEITDLSASGGPIPGQSADFAIDLGGQKARKVPADMPADGLTFNVSLVVPSNPWTLRAEEEITGKLKLTASVDGQPTAAEWEGDFVARRTTSIAGTLVLIVLGVLIIAIATALVYLLLAPKKAALCVAGQPLTEAQFTVPRGGGVSIGNPSGGFPLPRIDREVASLRRKGLGWVVCPVADAKVGDAAAGIPQAVRPGLPFRLDAGGQRVELELRAGRACISEVPEESSWH